MSGTQQQQPDWFDPNLFAPGGNGTAGGGVSGSGGYGNVTSLGDFAKAIGAGLSMMNPLGALVGIASLPAAASSGSAPGLSAISGALSGLFGGDQMASGSDLASLNAEAERNMDNGVPGLAGGGRVGFADGGAAQGVDPRAFVLGALLQAAMMRQQAPTGALAQATGMPS